MNGDNGNGENGGFSNGGYDIEAPYVIEDPGPSLMNQFDLEMVTLETERLKAEQELEASKLAGVKAKTGIADPHRLGPLLTYSEPTEPALPVVPIGLGVLAFYLMRRKSWK